MIKFKKSADNAIIPKRQTEGAAGFDLHSIESGVVLPGLTAVFDTGLSMAIQRATMARLARDQG